MNAQAEAPRAGWPEVLAGLSFLTVVVIGGAIGLIRMRIDPALLGLLLAGLSGVGAAAAFFPAFALRLRSWPAFGVRHASWRWLATGAALGVVAFVFKGIAILAYTHVTGDGRTPQDIYGTGASGGPGATIVATFLLAVVTPIGEELLFRGVVTTALLRYGAIAGVVGGALIFATFHGINMVFPAALVTGLVAGEVYRRSGSVWPGVAVHVVVNLPTIPVMLLAGIGR